MCFNHIEFAEGIRVIEESLIELHGFKDDFKKKWGQGYHISFRLLGAIKRNWNILNKNFLTLDCFSLGNE